jgi:predicted nucleic acid-binding protein
MTDMVVIDASLAVMWVVPESYTDRALLLASQWSHQSTRLISPCLILPEIANALYKRVIRKEMVLSAAIEALNIILAFGMEIREEPGLHSLAIELAHQLGRPTTYDCHYLALAKLHNCELWTGDRKFYNSVRKKIHSVKWIGNYPTSHGN